MKMDASIRDLGALEKHGDNNRAIGFQRRDNERCESFVTAQTNLQSAFQLVQPYLVALQSDTSLARYLNVGLASDRIVRRVDRLFDPICVVEDERGEFDKDIRWLDLILEPAYRPVRRENGCYYVSLDGRKGLVKVSEQDHDLILSGLPRQLIQPKSYTSDVMAEMDAVDYVYKEVSESKRRALHFIELHDQIIRKAMDRIEALNKLRPPGDSCTAPSEDPGGTTSQSHMHSESSNDAVATKEAAKSKKSSSKSQPRWTNEELDRLEEWIPSLLDLSDEDLVEIQSRLEVEFGHVRTHGAIKTAAYRAKKRLASDRTVSYTLRTRTTVASDLVPEDNARLEDPHPDNGSPVPFLRALKSYTPAESRELGVGFTHTATSMSIPHPDTGDSFLNRPRDDAGSARRRSLGDVPAHESPGEGLRRSGEVCTAVTSPSMPQNVINNVNQFTESRGEMQQVQQAQQSSRSTVGERRDGPPNYSAQKRPYPGSNGQETQYIQTRTNTAVPEPSYWTQNSTTGASRNVAWAGRPKPPQAPESSGPHSEAVPTARTSHTTLPPATWVDSNTGLTHPPYTAAGQLTVRKRKRSRKARSGSRSESGCTTCQETGDECSDDDARKRAAQKNNRKDAHKPPGPKTPTDSTARPQYLHQMAILDSNQAPHAEVSKSHIVKLKVPVQYGNSGRQQQCRETNTGHSPLPANGQWPTGPGSSVTPGNTVTLNYEVTNAHGPRSLPQDVPRGRAIPSINQLLDAPHYPSFTPMVQGSEWQR